MTTRKQPAALVPSDPSEWGTEPQQKEHLLPSGRVMTLRRAPAMRRLVMQGVVPSSLLGVELVPSDGSEERTFSINAKLFEEQRAAVVCAMVVQPAVVLEPLKDVGGFVLYDDVPEKDVEYIISWTQEGLAGIAQFPVDAGSDADGESGEGLGESSK